MIDLDDLEAEAHREAALDGNMPIAATTVLDLIRQLRTAETIIGKGLRDQAVSEIGLSEAAPRSPLVSCVRIDDDGRMTLSMRGGAEVTIGAVFTASEARELAELLAPRTATPATTRDASKRGPMAPSLRLEFDPEPCSCDESIALRKRVAELEVERDAARRSRDAVLQSACAFCGKYGRTGPEDDEQRALREIGTWLYEGHTKGERRTFRVDPTLCESAGESHVCYLYRDHNREHLANGCGATPAAAQLAALKRYREERETDRG